MAESDRDHSSEMEASLDGKHHRWLRPEEIRDVLRNPNGFTISEEPAIMPPSGSIFFFDKNVLKRFRKDGYKWKKAKGGKIVKEAHERLKVEGVDALHCYYAHREDDEDFQRRSYWMIDKNLSHRVLVHYLHVKEDQGRTGKVVLPSCKTDASATNHQDSFGLPHVPGSQYENASISNPSNFQHSQATDANFQDFLYYDPCDWGFLENSFTGLPDPCDWGILENSFTGLPACTNSRASSSAAVEPSHSSLGKRQCDSTKSKATPLATIEEVDEEEEGNDTNQARKRLKVTCGQKSIATSAATNITAAPESSNPAVLQSRPTSDANQDFVQEVENQEQELEPTSIEPENGKNKAVVQNDFGTGKSHEFSEVALMGLHELLDRASAPNTLASSSISTPTIDSQAIATIRTTLEMDFTTMVGDVQRTDKISLIKSFVDSNCFPTSSRTSILPMLNQLEQSLQAYSEYDKGKNLNAEVEDMIKRLQPKVQFYYSRKRDLQRLENEKMSIEAEQAVIRAEIVGAFKETEPIQAELRELVPQRDQFKENEGNLKTNMDIGDCFWTTLKKVIPRHLPP